MHLLLTGLSHEAAGIEVRERAAVGPELLPAALTSLRGQAGVEAAFVLSTCSRTEVYVTGRHLSALRKGVRCSLSEVHPDGYPVYSASLAEATDAGAAGHLFRTTAGVNSMLLGESQVLGQVRRAAQEARRLGALDHILSGTADRAVAAARRARRSSGIGRGAVSVGQAAAAHVRERLGGLTGVRVLVLGAGEVGDLAVKALTEGGATVQVGSRGGASAISLAGRHGAQAVDLRDLAGLLAEVDVVVASSSAPGALLTRRLLAAAARGRVRPLIVLDLALPRDVEPGSSDVEGVEVIDVDDLSRSVQAGLARREQALARALEVLEDEVEAWRTWFASASLRPTMAAITGYADGVREREVRKAMRGLGNADPRVARRMEAMSRSLVAKLLLHPIGYLRANPQDTEAGDLLARLFSEAGPGESR